MLSSSLRAECASTASETVTLGPKLLSVATLTEYITIMLRYCGGVQHLVAQSCW
jgi:hypothetical protein